MTEISVTELKRRRDSGEAHVLVDVREPDEVATAGVAGALTIPMREIPARVAELPRDRPLIVMCHHGARSARVVAWLNAQGFAQAVNLAGGIDAWAETVDPSVPRY